jgi:hypothetical protein
VFRGIDDPSKIAFDSTKAQAAVVGADLVTFVKGVSEQNRSDILNATLLAQLVAKKQVPAPETLAAWAAWYDVYFDVMTHLGFGIQDKGFAEYQTNSTNFEAHQAIIQVAETLFAGAPAALAVITTALKALQEMDEDSPWIRLFDRESKSAQTARFQVTTASEDNGEAVVSIIAFGLEATSRITQVLFFKFHANAVKLQNHSGKVSINAAVLAGVRPDVSAKLVGFAEQFVRGLPDL